MIEELIKQTTDQIFKITGGSHFVTPEQLSKIIGISAKQQSVLRSAENFPIEWEPIGRLVRYRVAVVVEYLITGSSKANQSKAQQKIVKSPARPASNRRPKDPRAISQHLLLRNFVSMLNQERQSIEVLHDNLVGYCDMKEFEDHLHETLPIKAEPVKKPKAFKA